MRPTLLYISRQSNRRALFGVRRLAAAFARRSLLLRLLQCLAWRQAATEQSGSKLPHSEGPPSDS